MATRNKITPFTATHPGILIRDELEARPELKQKDLAKELGVKATFLNEVIKGKRSVSADLAVLLEEALGISAEYWLRFQSQYDIDKARVKEKVKARLSNMETWSKIKEYVLVSNLKKRGYLRDDIESDIKAVKKIFGIDKVEEIEAGYKRVMPAFYRKSEKLQVDERNLYTWSALARYEAKKQNVGRYDPNKLDQLCKDLNEQLFRNSDTLKNVADILGIYGVKFVLVEKLEKTPVDGFTFWSDENPAIAFTLRHKRIDNFAFNLMHEIAHIARHLNEDRSANFINLTGCERISKTESEADKFAQETLIPAEAWSELVMKSSLSIDEKLLSIGEKYSIHPAILLGRWCFVTNNYALSSKIDKSLH